MEIWRLRLFADDGETIAAEFSTDPTHERPWLIAPEAVGGQDINLAEGRATISGAVLEVVDTDEYVTSLLPAPNGRSARIGRRAELAMKNGGPDFESVLSGVIDDVELQEGLSSFTLAIKDERENERRTQAFIETTSCSIIPRGVIDGFGRSADGSAWLIEPTEPLRATYGENVETIFGFSRTHSELVFPTPTKDKNGFFRPPSQQVVTDTMRAALGVTTYADIGLNVQTNEHVRILWRAVGATAWNVILRPPVWTFVARPEILTGKATSADGETDVNWLNSFQWEKDTEQPHPSDGDTVEVVFGYIGEPTEDWPFHYEGTFGDLLKRIYDAEYSDGGAVVRYDETAVLALGERCLARITEALNDDDGVWKWVEANIYAPLGAAPTLDAVGQISPVRYTLPDVDADLIQLDDTNCELMPGWSHSGSDAVNVVSVTYKRLYRVPSDIDPLGKTVKGDGLAAREIVVEHKVVDSIGFLGERPLKIKADTLCAIGGTEGEALNGDVANEFGAQLAAARTREATDRFLMGGQHFVVRALRDSTDVVAPGQWCIVACSWMPDYATGERGANRLAQVVRVMPLDSTAYELELIDAGPDNQPLLQPTLNAASAVVLPDGSVTFNVTAIPAGVEARIDFNLSDTLPSSNDAGWTYATRITSPGPVIIPPQPSGGTIWIRGRGESPGQRPSAWTVPFSVVISEIPRVRKAKVTLSKLGLPTVTYTPNGYCDGVRIYRSIHLARTTPVFTLYQDFAATGTNVLAGVKVRPGEVLDVRIEAWSGFNGTNVTGTKGDTASARTAMAPNGASLGMLRFGARRKTSEYVDVGGIPGALVDYVAVYLKTYQEPESAVDEEIVPEIDETDVPVSVLDPATDLDTAGYLTYRVTRPPKGYARYVWFLVYDADGNEGETQYMLRVDYQTAGEPPHFDHWKQSSPDLLVTDVYGRVVDPEEDPNGGTLSVWAVGSDFSGDPDGTRDVTVEEMPFSFGPATVFSSTPGGTLLNDLEVPPTRPPQIALKFDCADGRSTGQVLITLKDEFNGLVDEFGALRANSWRNAMKLASSTEGVGVGEILPPDGDTYQEWYKPSENTLYKWNTDTSAWEVDEGTGRLAFGNAVGGLLLVGAINAQAIQAGAINAKLVGAYRLIADNLDIGQLSLISADAGAVICGELLAVENPRDEDGNPNPPEAWGDTIAYLNLEATGDDPVLWHSQFQLKANGDAVFAGELSAATGSFAGSLSAASGTFNGSIILDSTIGNQIQLNDSFGVGMGDIRVYDLGSIKRMFVEGPGGTLLFEDDYSVGHVKKVVLSSIGAMSIGAAGTMTLQGVDISTLYVDGSGFLKV